MTRSTVMLACAAFVLALIDLCAAMMVAASQRHAACQLVPGARWDPQLEACRLPPGVVLIRD